MNYAKPFFVMGILFIIFSGSAKADPIMDILALLTNMNGNSTTMMGYQNNIDELTKELNKNVTEYLTGHHGWGTYHFEDLQSYGVDSQNWSSVLNLAQQGGSQTALGQEMHLLARQFPMNTALINHTISDPATQKYYALQSQTVLASRAASQLDFDKIQKQIAYQQALQQQIEKTTDLKAAMDLHNRIQVEGNLIQLEILRQNALSNQQQAVTSQGELNDLLLNNHFLQNPGS